MLDSLFGNKTATKILQYLHQTGYGNGNKLARDLKIPLNMVQKQLERLRKGGVLTSQFIGKSKIYSLDKNTPIYPPLTHMLQISLKSEKNVPPEFPNPADGRELSLKNRLQLSEELFLEAGFLNPYPHPEPFVKTFESFQEYEKWKTRQKNPWLIQ